MHATMLTIVPIFKILEKEFHMLFLSLNWHTLDLQVHFLAMAVLLIFIAMLLMTFPTGSDDGSINTLLQSMKMSIKMVIKTLEHVFWAHLQQMYFGHIYNNCITNVCTINLVDLTGHAVRGF